MKRFSAARALEAHDCLQFGFELVDRVVFHNRDARLKRNDRIIGDRLPDHRVKRQEKPPRLICYRAARIDADVISVAPSGQADPPLHPKFASLLRQSCSIRTPNARRLQFLPFQCSWVTESGSMSRRQKAAAGASRTPITTLRMNAA
jgi:hypothetical protein